MKPNRSPITITGQRGNAVLVSEADWGAIQETIYLQSLPGMAASIRAARSERVDPFEGLGW